MTSEDEDVMPTYTQTTDQVNMDDEESFLSTQDLERVKEECRTNKHVKPPYSYIALITMAVLQVLTSIFKLLSIVAIFKILVFFNFKKMYKYSSSYVILLVL